MTKPTCDACTKPVADSAHLCSRCTDILARDLGDVAFLAGELDTTRWGQATRGRQVGGTKSDEQPIPFDVAASDIAELLRSTLVSWARIIVEERGLTWPADTVPAVAAFVMLHLDWLRHHPAAGEALDEIRYAIGQARRVIDLAPNRTTFLVGPCPETEDTGPCPGEVRAYIATREDQPSRMECSVCSTAFAPHEWLRAGRRILDAGGHVQDTPPAGLGTLKAWPVVDGCAWVSGGDLHKIDPPQCPEPAAYRFCEVNGRRVVDACEQHAKAFTAAHPEDWKGLPLDRMQEAG